MARRAQDPGGSRPDQPIATLSGGNQQKVLLARWLERASPLLVLVEPTRGVDVGARADIYRALRELAADGTAVLVATCDYEEVVQLADRAVVMARGRSCANCAATRSPPGAHRCGGRMTDSHPAVGGASRSSAHRMEANVSSS